MLRSWWLFFGATTFAVGSSAIACGDDGAAPGANDSGSSVNSGGSDGSTNDEASVASDGAVFDVRVPDSGGGGTSFAYHPGWSGVTEVDVIGGFGQSNDWDPNHPYLVLTDDGTGNYTGNAALPAGTYPYLFHVIGDAASNQSNFDRYTIDPLNTAVLACP